MFKRKYEFTCDSCGDTLLVDVNDRLAADDHALNNGYVKLILTKKSECVYKTYDFWICSKCKAKIYNIVYK